MKFSHTLKTTASPSQVWEIWIDVAHWSQWDTELTDACVAGLFELGATGELTPKTGRASTFTISQFSPNESYTFTIELPFCCLNIHRYLRSQAGITYFTHEVSFDGWLAWAFGLLLGRKFRSVLPSVMENIKRIAEHSPST